MIRIGAIIKKCGFCKHDISDLNGWIFHYDKEHNVETLHCAVNGCKCKRTGQLPRNWNCTRSVL